MKRTTLAIAALLAAIAGLILYSTLSLGGYSCEVCIDRKSTRLNSSHIQKSRMPSSA